MVAAETEGARERAARERADRRVAGVLGSAQDRAGRVEPGSRSEALADAFEVPGPGSPRMFQDVIDEYVEARWQDRLGLTRGFEHVRDVAGEGEWGEQVACVRRLYRETDRAITGDKAFQAGVHEELEALCKKAGATEFDMALVRIDRVPAVVDVLHRHPDGSAYALPRFPRCRRGAGRSRRRPGIPTSRRCRPSGPRAGAGRPGRVGASRSIRRFGTGIWRSGARRSSREARTTWRSGTSRRRPARRGRSSQPRVGRTPFRRRRRWRLARPRQALPTGRSGGLPATARREVLMRRVATSLLGAAMTTTTVWRSVSRGRAITPTRSSASTSSIASTVRCRRWLRLSIASCPGWLAGRTRPPSPGPSRRSSRRGGRRCGARSSRLAPGWWTTCGRPSGRGTAWARIRAPSMRPCPVWSRPGAPSIGRASSSGRTSIRRVARRSGRCTARSAASPGSRPGAREWSRRRVMRRRRGRRRTPPAWPRAMRGPSSSGVRGRSRWGTSQRRL